MKNNYTKKNGLVAMAQILFGFKLCLEYPVFQYLGWCVSVGTSKQSDSLRKCRTGVQSALIGLGGSSVEGHMRRCEEEGGVSPWRAVSSGIWVAGTAVIAHFATSIADVIPVTAIVVLQFQFTIPGSPLLLQSPSSH